MRVSHDKGFTFIETLVVLVILAIGMAVAIPMFVTAISDGKVKQCRTNMQAIANSEEEYKIKAATHTYTTVLANLGGSLPVVPICPNGGTYTVTISDGTARAQTGQTVPAGHLVVSCSNGSHGKFAPTIDAQ
jgi:prepilin-type N-terminal cleavage/methylation domain-containing protein